MDRAEMLRICRAVLDALQIPPAPVEIGRAILGPQSGWYGARIPLGVKLPTDAECLQQRDNYRLIMTAHHHGVTVTNPFRAGAWNRAIARADALAN